MLPIRNPLGSLRCGSRNPACHAPCWFQRCYGTAKSSMRVHRPPSRCVTTGSAVGVEIVTSYGGSGNSNNAGGDGMGGGKGGDGSGGNDDHSGGQPFDTGVAAILTAAGRKIDSFPSDFATALLRGQVTAEVLKRFLAFEANFWTGLVWGFQGFRERLLGDSQFPAKMAIELGIGVVMKLTAEKTRRGDAFWSEVDFVGANLIMALIADFMLTWLPAPTLSYVPKKASNNAILNFFAACPDNAFQKVQPGMPAFTIAQRFGAILRNGAKLLGVGFTASLLGVALANGLIAVRQQLDPAWASPNKPQDVLSTSLAYGVYMSVSSNLRYQFIAGIIEERGIEVWFRNSHQMCTLLSFLVRTANTFVGSLLWVDFVRLCGMQKAQPIAVTAHVKDLFTVSSTA